MSAPQNNELRIRVIEARELKAADMGGTSDPYVECRIISMKPIKDKAVKTKTILKTIAPRWDEIIGPLHPADVKDDQLEVKVYDHNALSTNELIGIVSISIAIVARSPGGHVDDWWDLHHPSNKAQKGKGSVHIVLDLLIDGRPPVPQTQQQQQQQQQPFVQQQQPQQPAYYSAPSAFPPPVAPPPYFQQPPPGYVPAPAAVPAVGFVQQQQQQFGDSRPPCRYGAACYRKNPEHFREFSHPPGHPGSSGF